MDNRQVIAGALFSLLLIAGNLPGTARAEPVQDYASPNAVYGVLPKDASEALNTAASVTLYSLQPWGGPDLPDWDFHQNHILGQVVLNGQQARQAVGAFNDAIAAGKNAPEGLCIMDPRHGLRVSFSGHFYDFELCYHCGGLAVIRDHLAIAILTTRGTPDVLNRLLTKAGLPLADTPAVRQSYAEEAEIALHRAKRGDKDAQYVIGISYLSGRGIATAQNESAGIKWIIKSWGNSPNDAETEFKLGKLFENTLGVPYDTVKAAKWYLKSAEQGFAPAEYKIGAEFAKEANQTPSEALTWIRKAAAQGNADAQGEMGNYYRDGSNGVRQDNVQSYMWYELAIGSKENSTPQFLEDLYRRGEIRSRNYLAAKMSPAQIAEAKRLVAAWKPSPASANKDGH